MKTAYLTIDDSPSIDMQAKVDYLFRLHIPAVFFCRGDFMEARPKPVLDAIRKGFIIANHSYSHPHFSDIDIQSAYIEIEKTDKIIDNLYERAGVKRPCKWFRFPFGDKGDGRYGKVLEPIEDANGQTRKDIIQAMLRGMGYQQKQMENVNYHFYKKAGLWKDVDWHWTYDTMEWSLVMKRPVFGIRALKDVVLRMDEQSPNEARGLIDPDEKRWLQSDHADIILLHDHEETTDVFEPIIEAYLKRNVQFLDFESAMS